MTKKLTDAAVRALPAPAAGNRITYDSQVSGFGARVTAGGARSFVLNYRVEGRERRITIGPYPAWSVEAARKRAQALRRQADTGADPLAERERRRDADTIAELADRYIAEHARPHKRSWAEDRRRLEKHVLPVWKTRKIEDIERRHVGELIGRIARDTPIEANRVLALVRKMFSFAIDAGLVTTHPCLRMSAPSPERARERALVRPEELRAFWEITGGGKWADAVPAREAAALRLLLLTGARASEVAELPRRELHLDVAEWHLPASRNKGKRDQLVPLVDEAVDIVQAQPDGGQYVFQGARGGPLTKKHLARALSTACEWLADRGIERFTPHDVRRSVETGMASIGIAKEVRDRVLNHKDASVGAVNYNRHDFKAEKRAALEAWAAYVDRIVSGRDDKVTPFRRKAG